VKDETFVNQRRFLWLWVCALALIVLSAIYLLDRPIGVRYGGTKLGVIYGIIAAAGIAFLMWYGIRKRYSYRRGGSTLKRWLGPHVWIGVSLVLLVPLHSGFSLSWNVHAAPYLLMLLTVVSGIWGAYAYLRYPPQMTSRREGITLRSSVDQIEAISRELAALGKGKSAAFAAAASRMEIEVKPTFWRVLFGRPFRTFGKQDLSDLLATLPPAEYQAGLTMTEMASRRIMLANRLVAEASVVAQMRLWLYFHLPLSFGCAVAVAAHIFWVLFYRWPTT
jgi:hypothetical protein